MLLRLLIVTHSHTIPQVRQSSSRHKGREDGSAPDRCLSQLASEKPEELLPGQKPPTLTHPGLHIPPHRSRELPDRNASTTDFRSHLGSGSNEIERPKALVGPCYVNLEACLTYAMTIRNASYAPEKFDYRR